VLSLNFRPFTAVGILLALSAFAAVAKEPVPPVNASRGIAIKSYDPVAYFEQSKPVKGAKQFTHEWMGANWQFASAANRDLFAGSPAKFVPQYGGYCAWAVSNNYTAEVDPEAWTIRDGRLFLNYSKKVQAMWLKEIDQRIVAGDRNWPGLHK
jgi:hypothetical protein